MLPEYKFLVCTATWHTRAQARIHTCLCMQADPNRRSQTGTATGPELSGRVYGVLDSNNTGTSEGTVILLSGLNKPNGIAWHNGSLYVAEINKITRYDDADAFVIANRVRHCHFCSANHGSMPRVMLRLPFELGCNACYARQQSVKIQPDVRPNHSAGSVMVSIASVAATVWESTMQTLVLAPLHSQAAGLV